MDEGWLLVTGILLTAVGWLGYLVGLREGARRGADRGYISGAEQGFPVGFRAGFGFAEGEKVKPPKRRRRLPPAVRFSPDD